MRRREVKEGTAGKRGEGKCQDECNMKWGGENGEIG